MSTMYPMFVYGTLLAGESAHALIQPHITSVSPALLPGADLYSLGAYPMLMHGDRSVHGELCYVASDAYAHLLQTLDRYEGPQYARELLNVHVDGNETVQAWVYAGTQLPKQANLIESGDWRARTP